VLFQTAAYRGANNMRFPLFTDPYIVWAYQLFRGRDVEFIEGIDMLPWWEIQSIGKDADHRTDFRNTIIERRDEIGQLNRHH